MHGRDIEVTLRASKPTAARVCEAQATDGSSEPDSMLAAVVRDRAAVTPTPMDALLTGCASDAERVSSSRSRGRVFRCRDRESP